MKNTEFTFKKYRDVRSTIVGYISLFIYLVMMSITYYYSILTILKSGSNWVSILYISFSLLTQTLFFYPGILCLITSIISLILGKKSFNFSTSIVSLKKYQDLSNVKVALLYTTKDDFITDAASTMLNQQTLDGKINKNYVPIILDDSTKERFISIIDKFSKDNSVKVIRRGNNGPRTKSGNLNYFFENFLNDFDYFVVLDADTYLENKWCSKAIQYFERFKDVGIVQGLNNVVTNINNFFQDFITPNNKESKEFWGIEGEICNLYSIMLCTGHACMWSKDLIKKNEGKIVNCISEDWTLFIDAKKFNYECVYTSNCIAKEEVPPNYYAYKKRHLRWEGGAFEFFHSYFFKILKSKFHFWQKWLIFNQATNIFLTPFNFFVNSILTFLMMFFSGDQTYVTFPYFVSVMNIVLFILSAITLPGKAVIAKSSPIRVFITSYVTTFVTTSIMPSLLIEYLMMLCGKKIIFRVSIKENMKITFKDFIKGSWFDVVFWAMLFIFMFAACWYANAWYFLLTPWTIITFLSFGSIFVLPFLSNITYKKFSI